MKDDLRQALTEIASHPATFGISAAIARWWLGDAIGGWRGLSAYITCSLFVAWSASFYLAEEAMASGRRSFYLLLLAFVAKDLLTAIAAIAAQFRVDPFGVIARIREALAGGPKS